MTTARTRKYRKLEAKLGYKFKSQALLQRALTHASVRGGKAAPQDNERLEFLGDRVLGLAVAGLLDESFPEAKEGELARRLNKLVCGRTCANVGRALELGPDLVLSDAEAQSGGRDKETILADAVEAILGAIYTEAGFDRASVVVLRLWQPFTDAEHPRVAADSKSRLQEWAQGRGLALPQYRVLERKGPDHAPHFTAEVRIANLAPAPGEGSSKREAEQAAAAALLIREGVLKGSEHD
ncbi:MAG: ribonuclease III [Hyphomicrobium sp.]|nr:ribonuclease III [Hyphomicrobium sp.]